MKPLTEERGMPRTAQDSEVLDFWFSEPARSRWFRSTPEFDAQLRDRFLSVWRDAFRG